MAKESWNGRSVTFWEQYAQLERVVTWSSLQRFASSALKFISKEVNISSACLYIDHQKTELILHDGTLLTFPFAENNMPYMLTD
jgi:hypothetical protein